MTAKKTSAAQARPEFDIHARGAEYISPAAWKKHTDQCLQMFTGVILGTITGNAENRQFGSATLAYDAATTGKITEAVGQLHKAIAQSKAVWLPGAEKAQQRLRAARSDQRFQSFLAGLVQDAPLAKTINPHTKKGGAA